MRAFISTTGIQENSVPSSSTPKAGRYSGLIEEAGRKIKSSPAGSDNHIQRAWSEIDWNECEDQRVTSDAEYSPNNHRIAIYPSILAKSKEFGVFTLAREFGRMLFHGAPATTKEIWDKKLCLPTRDQIDAVQRKLTPEFKSYQGVVDSFKTVTDKYVAINIANALKATGVSYGQVQNVDIRKWGATQEYAKLKRYHTLIPYVSAYASKDIYNDFGTAFADWVCELNGITESSVAEATHGIIKSILGTLR